MKLRTQTAVLSLSLLAIPWLSIEFFHKNQEALLTLQRQTLESTAQGLSAVLTNDASALYADERRLVTPLEEASLLVGDLQEAPILDGNLDEWSDIPQRTFGTERRPFTVSMVSDDQYLYIGISVAEETKVYRADGSSQGPNGDRLILRTWLKERREEYVIATPKPGPVVGKVYGGQLPSAQPSAITGVWLDTDTGYQIELRLPHEITQSRLGIYYIDVDEGGISTRGNVRPIDTAAPPWLIETPPALATLADHSDKQGIKLTIHDRWGWPLVTTQQDTESATGRNTPWVSAFYNVLFDVPAPDLSLEYATNGRETSLDIVNSLRGQPGHSLALKNGQLIARYATPINSDAGVMGVVVAEQPRRVAIVLATEVVQRLLLQIGVATALIAGCFLGFSTLLTRRIRRLDAHLIETTQKGGREPLVESWLNDEIDHLTKRLNVQMEEQQRLQGYLRRLPHSLSHEIRTPVAVIRSTLDLLSDTENIDPRQQADLILRARTSLERLGHIIAVMNEANRLEKAIYVDEKQATDLKSLLTELSSAYSSTYPQWTFRLKNDDPEAIAPVSPDLIVQALDKLVSNAMSFTDKGETIILRLERRGLWWRITVANPGHNLPEAREDLFAPMVSVRGTGGERHLGLGLYMVALIAKHHGGEPWARNTPEHPGAEVGFTVRA
ncbi:MAG: ATP-binding protein [Luminiphilus sp.]